MAGVITKRYYSLYITATFHDYANAHQHLLKHNYTKNACSQLYHVLVKHIVHLLQHLGRRALRPFYFVILHLCVQWKQ